jgi:hypothetical protein
MSAYPGLVLDFQLVHPASVRGPMKVLCQDRIRDIYNNIVIRTKAKTGPIQHLQPVILRIMRAHGDLNDLASVMVTLKLRKRREALP